MTLDGDLVLVEDETAVAGISRRERPDPGEDFDRLNVVVGQLVEGHREGEKKCRMT